MKEKSIFIHPAIRSYREELFSILSKKLDVEFFWSQDVSLLDEHIKDEVNTILKRNEIKYIQSNEFNNIPIKGFSFDLFTLLFKSYDLYIFSSILSIPFLILAPIIKLKKKKIIIFDELWRYPKEIKKFKIAFFYIKFLVKYCVDSFILSGTKSKEFFTKDFLISSEKIFIAYNTTRDLNDFIIDEKKDNKIFRKLNKITLKKKLLFLARIIEIKGLDILIKAMKNISDEYDLIVVGSGDNLNQCKKLTLDLSLEKRIHFIGPCLSSESIYYYKYTDIFILPSRFLLDHPVQVESWGFTINEAMYMKKPVVSTTAVGAAFDLIEDSKTGAIAKESNILDLAEKINFVIKNNINNCMGISARKRILEISSYKQNYKSFYDAIHINI